jgi:hypothetical protein
MRFWLACVSLVLEVNANLAIFCRFIKFLVKLQTLTLKFKEIEGFLFYLVKEFLQNRKNFVKQLFTVL